MLPCFALTVGEQGFEAGCSGYQMAAPKGSKRENIKGPGLQFIVWAVISHCLLSEISAVFLFFFFTGVCQFSTYTPLHTV